MPDNPSPEIQSSGHVFVTIHPPPPPPQPWESVVQALCEVEFQHDRMALARDPKDPWELFRSSLSLRRDGNRVTYQSGTEKVLWTVDIEGADEGAIDAFLNRVFGVGSDGSSSTFERLDVAMATDYGPCFNLGRLIWAGKKLAANRPLRRRLWALRYRLPSFRRWMEDPIVDPELQKCCELLCAAALLGTLRPARATEALVEIGEIPDAAEAHPYGEWRVVLEDVLNQLSDHANWATSPPARPPSDHAHEAVNKARGAIAQAIHELERLSSPPAPPPSPPAVG